MQGITIVLSLLCGVALFLYGMSLMGDGLKKVAGNKLETVLYRLTNTPIKGLLLGTAVTAVIQSSSATTIMVVGFVNSGMMKVAQAIGIIMGANIGTSVTGWILCLSYIEGSSGIAQLISTATISAIVAITGTVLKMVSKKVTYKNIADIMIGFAILMVGMQTMSAAVSPLKSNPTFTGVLTMFTNPIMGIIVGILFTAVLQSASASVGILQALAMTGSISFAAALPITMGIGVGAACPVLLSSIGSNKNGKRTALIYLLNDLFGMIFWSIVFYAVNAFVHFSFMNLTMTPVMIALVNTVYRVATILVLAPCIKLIEKLVYKLVKDDPEDEDDAGDFDILEDRFLAYPGLAISQSRMVMNGMARKTRKNVKRAMNLLEEFKPDKFKRIQDKEDVLDKYEDKVGSYLTQLTISNLTEIQARKVSLYLHAVSDFERIGDHAVAISYVAKEMFEKKAEFSEEALFELKVLGSAVKEIVNLTTACFSDEDMDKAKRIEPLRDVIKMLADDLRVHHIRRLQAGECDIAKGFIFTELLNNWVRIAAHCSNVAVALLEVEDSSMASHEYTQRVRKSNNQLYENYLQDYAEHYSIKAYDPFADKFKVVLEEE